MHKNYLLPSEITREVVGVGEKKAAVPAVNQFLLAVLGGAFIAFAAEASNMAIHILAARDFGLGRVVAGIVFTPGLMLVAVAGAELFTGNTLMVMALAEKRITWSAMLRNWLVVYAGNLAGSLLLALMMAESGLFGFSNGQLGGHTIRVALHKTGFTFLQAVILGILCNWLVCLALWMAYGAKDITGKLLAIYFPISLFITSGFEHCVANMYYIPAGILARGNELWAQASGFSPERLGQLTWGAFLMRNLVPVTLGNLIGGVILLAGVYWWVYVGGERIEERRRDRR